MFVHQWTAVRVNRPLGRGVRWLLIAYHWFLALLTFLPAWHGHSHDSAAGFGPPSS
jgi:hypothetical protein